jgi:hypothetical protein
MFKSYARYQLQIQLGCNGRLGEPRSPHPRANCSWLGQAQCGKDVAQFDEPVVFAGLARCWHQGTLRSIEQRYGKGGDTATRPLR